MANKDCMVAFRITEKQMERLEAIAEHEGVKPGDMARTILLNAIPTRLQRIREETKQEKNSDE
jgi:hypothetical protein